MLSCLSFFTTLILSAILCVSSQGTNPSGQLDGAAFYNAAEKLTPGVYQFKAHQGDNSLTLFSGKTTVEPLKNGTNQWVVEEYPKVFEKTEKETKYFSASINTTACLEKTISTRWTVITQDGKQVGYPDAAVLWQREVDRPKKSSYGGYTPIVLAKQVWLAVPDQKVKGAYKLVSASHLYDMIPNCIANKLINGGTALAKCKIDTDDPSLLWTIDSVPKNEQKLQQCPRK